jgi:hypothetical protein
VLASVIGPDKKAKFKYLKGMLTDCDLKHGGCRRPLHCLEKGGRFSRDYFVAAA